MGYKGGGEMLVAPKEQVSFGVGSVLLLEIFMLEIAGHKVLATLCPWKEDIFLHVPIKIDTFPCLIIRVTRFLSYIVFLCFTHCHDYNLCRKLAAITFLTQIRRLINAACVTGTVVHVN